MEKSSTFGGPKAASMSPVPPPPTPTHPVEGAKLEVAIWVPEAAEWPSCPASSADWGFLTGNTPAAVLKSLSSGCLLLLLRRKDRAGHSGRGRQRIPTQERLLWGGCRMSGGSGSPPRGAPLLLLQRLLPKGVVLQYQKLVPSPRGVPTCWESWKLICRFTSAHPSRGLQTFMLVW